MAGMVRASASRIGTGVQAYLAGPTNLFGARSCRRVSSTSRHQVVSHAVAERDAIKETVKQVIPDSDGPPPDSPVSFNMEEPPTPASSVSSAENGGDIEQGKIDDQWFTPHWSVEYWRELSAKRVEGTLGLSELASEAAQNRLSSEAFASFQCDLRNIKEGAYKLPWDMTTPGHRQYNPLFVLRQAALYLQEAPEVLSRRHQPEGKVGQLPYERSNMYPSYYQNNFHFQTDGWFSSRSADTYDVATETLFLGRQDAMQRGTLLAINRHFPGSTGQGLDVLEVGAGTGRLATFVRDNYPAARLTVSDLSPFYLEKARSNMAYWQRCASRSARSAGSVAFVQCAAEALPQEDASMDVVYCVYMFHEMPDDARRAALREFARVLKPGGVLVVTDSVQIGDRDGLANIRNFSAMNEPHYNSYVDFSFGREMHAAGLEPSFKSLASSSKTLTAVKR